MAMTLSKTKTFGGFAFVKLSPAVPKIRDLKKFREIILLQFFFNILKDDVLPNAKAYRILCQFDLTKSHSCPEG